MSPAASRSISTGTCGPNSFTAGLAAKLRSMGVDIVEGAEVSKFEVSSGTVTSVRTAKGDHRADAFLLAAGSWTTPLAKLIGVRFPMQAGKGYSFFVRPSVVPTHSILLADVHVGCTPLGDEMRIGGTMEFSGLNTRLDERRINDIITAARTAFQPWKSPDVEQKWAGMRPITADGLPILDRTALTNTYVSTGDAMQGVTLAAASRKGDGRVHRHRHASPAARAVRARAPAGPAKEAKRPWLSACGW